jgi:hypothetical protein
MPPGVLLVTGNTTTELPEPLMIAGEKLALIPLGGTVAVSITFPVNPAIGVTETVVFCINPRPVLSAFGETDNVKSGASKFTVEVPQLPRAIELHAFTTTAWLAVTADGAVYNPVALMEPIAGLMDQVVAWLLLGTFVTLAWNCCDWPSARGTELGLTATVTGARLIENVWQTFPNVKQAFA